MLFLSKKIRPFAKISVMPARYVFWFGMLGCGLLAIILGKDLTWDMANYHYYGPYAYLYQRKNIDFFPVSYVHQFINPAIDFLTYFLLTHFSPLIAEFILGCIHGINAGLLYLIARCFTANNLLAIFLAGLGLYGPIAFNGIGSFQNDNLISLFVLLFIYLQLRLLFFQQHQTFLQLLSGFVLGMGLGLKLPTGIFVVGSSISWLLLPQSILKRCKGMLLLMIGVIFGTLLIAGYWMLIQWQQFHNPIFPFFNQFFQSPDFPYLDCRDLRFMPKTWAQTLFYPFYFAWDGRTSDMYFQDIRFPVLYLLFGFAAGKSLVKYFCGTLKTNIPVLYLSSFFIFSFITWQIFFSIARYAVALEMLAPIMIFILLLSLIPHIRILIISCTVVFYSIIFFMVPCPVIRAPWYGATQFNVHLPSYATQSDKGTVITAYSAFLLSVNPRPQFYLIPFFAPGWHFTAIPFCDEKSCIDAFNRKKIAAYLNKSPPPFYLLTSENAMPELYRAALEFNLYPAGPCATIPSDRQRVTYLEAWMCPVTKNHQHSAV